MNIRKIIYATMIASSIILEGNAFADEKGLGKKLVKDNKMTQEEKREYCENIKKNYFQIKVLSNKLQKEYFRLKGSLTYSLSIDPLKNLTESEFDKKAIPEIKTYLEKRATEVKYFRDKATELSIKEMNCRK